MTTKEPIWTKAFISLFLTNLSVFIIFYGLVSTLPLYAKDVLSRTDEEAGLLMTIFLLSAIVVRPFTGKVLELVGKRKMLWIGLVFYLLCTILYYFIEPFQSLLILRFVQGIWFSIVTTAAGALAADNVPPTRRGAGLGYFVMSTNLAVVIGPFIALFIIQSYSFQTLFIVMSVLMVIGALASLTIPKDFVQVPALKKSKFSLNDLFEKKALPVAMLSSLIAFSYASVLSFLSIYAKEKNLLALASIFFVVYAVAMLVTRPFTGKVFDEKGPIFILIPGMIFFIIGLVLLAFMDTAWLFLVAGVFIGLGYGALVPCLQTLAIQSTSHERSGYATATFFTFFDFGIATGSYVLGLVAVYYGYQNVYLLSAALIVVVLLIYLFVGRKNKRAITVE
ncbi:MFS transporter [Filibacter tadaridae]|uniref:Bacillibactin exporter n=1 Tax=Filibacter tadaridae TaxID=2483811 RepID=A0A3P5XFI8_9BACL|nr:MFS transporter [Filibacter tadaridae]VDC33505.1 Bacillibactin exporter [Filibacter tadaridae]